MQAFCRLSAKTLCRGQFEWFNPIYDLLNERHFSRRFWQMQSVQLPGSIHVITNVTDDIRYLINLSKKITATVWL